MRNSPKILLTLAAVAMATLAFTASSAHAAHLAGELGVLDPILANGGVNPATGNAWAAGDTYRLGFVSEARRDALSPNIQDYHDHVTQAANNAGFGGNWYNIGRSLNDSDRAANAYTVNGNSTDVGLFLLDGVTKIADDIADLNNGPDHQIDLTEDLVTVSDRVATGSSRRFGDPSNNNAAIEHGRTDHDHAGSPDGHWWQQFNGAMADTNWRFYALSDDLTIQQVAHGNVVPEPASIAIWSILGLCLAAYGYRRRRNK